MYNETAFLSSLSRFPIRVSAHDFPKVYYKTVDVFAKSLSWLQNVTAALIFENTCTWCVGKLLLPNLWVFGALNFFIANLLNEWKANSPKPPLRETLENSKCITKLVIAEKKRRGSKFLFIHF